MLKRIFFIGFLSVAVCALADVKLPKIFSDNMVFQREIPVRIWGQSAARAAIDVEYNNGKVSTLASDKGKWSLAFPPMKADKIGKSVKIYENGKLSAEIKNAVVGEVWILSGQSNMDLRVSSTLDAKRLQKEGDYPLIRHLTMDVAASSPAKEADLPSGAHWQVCTPKTVAKFQAVGTYFAEQLFKDADVPVGIIGTALGATHVGMWVPRDACAGHAGLEAELRRDVELSKDYDYEKSLAAYKKCMADYAAEVASAKAEGRKMPKPLNWKLRVAPLKFTAQIPHYYPTGCYNAKIAPIVGYGIRGVVWYQGEGDALEWLAPYYEDSFSHMINVWRKAWGMPKMPFLFVQISSWEAPKEWSWNGIQAAQTNVWLKTPNAFMVTTTDIGEKKDIHPRDKTTVGRRLEKIALEKVYGQKGATSSLPPYFKSAKFAKSSVVMEIESFGDAVVFDESLRGFEVKTDGKWVDADAVASVSGKSVRVTSRDGSKIDGVRYLWKSWSLPDVCIHGANGQPASLAEFYAN